MSLGDPLKEATSWMVCRSHSLCDSLHLSHQRRPQRIVCRVPKVPASRTSKLFALQQSRLGIDFWTGARPAAQSAAGLGAQLAEPGGDALPAPGSPGRNPRAQGFRLDSKAQRFERSRWLEKHMDFPSFFPFWRLERHLLWRCVVCEFLGSRLILVRFCFTGSLNMVARVIRHIIEARSQGASRNGVSACHPDM